MSLLEDARATQHLAATDVVEIIGEALASTRLAQQVASTTGDMTALVRAATASHSIAATLLDRLNITDTDIATGLREGQQLAEATAYVARRFPEAGRAIQARLRYSGATDMATALDKILNAADDTNREEITS